jgi:hypothetical protein
LFELQETVAVPEPRTVVGMIIWQVRSDEVASASVTVLVNPLSSPTVIVEVACWPALTGVGDMTTIEKLGKLATSNVAPTEWLREPLVP